MNNPEKNEIGNENIRREAHRQYKNLITALALTPDNEKRELVEQAIDAINALKPQDKRFSPSFYRTGDLDEDAIRINRPHIQKEGQQENREQETKELFEIIKDFDYLERRDVLNIQNHFLKSNNYKGIIGGLRTHDVSFEESAPYRHLDEIVPYLFPISTTDKQELLDFYRRIQTVHPLSDLNGRVFGLIVAHLYHRGLKSQ